MQRDFWLKHTNKMDISSTILGKRQNNAHDTDTIESNKKQHVDTLPCIVGYKVVKRKIDIHVLEILYHIFVGMTIDNVIDYLMDNFDYGDFSYNIALFRYTTMDYIDFGNWAYFT